MSEIIPKYLLAAIERAISEARADGQREAFAHIRKGLLTAAGASTDTERSRRNGMMDAVRGALTDSPRSVRDIAETTSRHKLRVGIALAALVKKGEAHRVAPGMFVRAEG